jgi:uncharacterized membrane protein|tara:strand:- start:160 stop:543 length:384 start_codon:yes stop_codon:yes gene_type:complete
MWWLLLMVTLVLDYFFLFLISGRVSKIIFRIQGSKMIVDKMYASIVYLFLFLQLYYFILLKKGTYVEAFVLGSTSYGIYEFTNMSLFKDWDYKLALIDTLWGGILYTLSIYITRYIMTLNTSINTIV